MLNISNLYTINWPIGLMTRVFTNIAGDQVESYQRLKKMVGDTTLLNTQHYMVRIQDKVEQSRERSSTLPYTLV